MYNLVTYKKAVQQAIALCLFSLCVLSTYACEVQKHAIEQAGIKNLRVVSGHIYSAGQPTQEQIQALKEAGIKHIVNLRPVSEQSWDEKAYVESLGMKYHSIPVAGMAGVTADNSKILQSVLDDIGDDSTVIHCASGRRVNALLDLKKTENKK